MNQNRYGTYVSPKDAINSSISTINDSYMTADESGNNSTQFFSVLEDSTDETILDDVSYNNLDVEDNEFTFTASGDANLTQKIVEDEQNAEENNSANELVIFKSANSAKLFGLQTTLNEQGNLEKYQYEVRQNEDGQYESIPGTIQMVPNDTTPASVISQMEEQEQQLISDDDSENVYIEDSPSEFTQIIRNEEEAASKQFEEEDHHISPQELTNLCMNIEENPEENQEHQLTQAESSIQFQENLETATLNTENTNTDEVTKALVKENILESALKCIYSPVKQKDSLVYKPQTNQVQNVSIQSDYTTQQNVAYVQNVPEKKVYRLQKVIRNPSNTAQRRTIALYPINKPGSAKVKNQLITTIELPRRQLPKLIVTANNAPLKTLNSLKRPHAASSITNAVIIAPQKENQVVPSKSTSSISIIKNNNNIRRSNVTDTNSSGSIPMPPLIMYDENKSDKRKTPMWNVNTMISQTKIIEAPVRQERLPRKQKIKPMERLGEELVFQHVTVSSSGVIETKEDGIVCERKELVPSECIQLSDNEDEVARRTRKRNAKKKQVEIVISDSDDETSENEENLENREESQEKTDEALKEIVAEENKDTPDDNLETHVVDLKENETIAADPKKKTATASSSAASSASGTAKHQCSICSETFINAFLTNKHEQLHKAKTKNECAVCKKLFNNAMALNSHKKIHGKNLERSSSCSTIPEKKSLRSQAKPKQTQSTPNSVQNIPKIMKAPTIPTRNTRHSVLKPESKPSPRSPRKSRPSFSVAKRSMIATRKSIVQPPSKSLMPPPSLARKSILPSKMTNIAPLGIKTRSSVAPSSTSLPQPSTSTQSTRQSLLNVHKCFSCNKTFAHKPQLDTHIIQNCVKSPKKLLKSSLAGKEKQETQGKTQIKPRTTSHSNKFKSPNTPAAKKGTTSTTSPSTSRKTPKPIEKSPEKISRTTRSSSTTALNANSTLRTRSTSSLSLNETVSGSMKKLDSAKKLPLSARPRIPTNAGLKLRERIRQPFMNFKRKLAEDSDMETDQEDNTRTGGTDK